MCHSVNKSASKKTVYLNGEAGNSQKMVPNLDSGKKAYALFNCLELFVQRNSTSMIFTMDLSYSTCKGPILANPPTP